MSKLITAFFFSLLCCRHVRHLDTSLYPIANENAFFLSCFMGKGSETTHAVF